MSFGSRHSSPTKFESSFSATLDGSSSPIHRSRTTSSSKYLSSPSRRPYSNTHGMRFSSETQKVIERELTSGVSATERLHSARRELKDSFGESSRSGSSPNRYAPRSPRRVSSPRHEEKRPPVDDLASFHISKLQEMVADKMDEQTGYEGLIHNKVLEAKRLTEVVRTVELQKTDLEYSLRAKDQEIQHLQDVIDSMKREAAFRPDNEREMERRIQDEVQRRTSALERELDDMQEHASATRDSRLQEMEKQHQKHIEELTKRFEAKLGALEATATRRVSEVHREHDQVDEVNIRRLRKLEQMYQEQVDTLQKVVQDEKSTNSELRDEIRARNTEFTSDRSQLSSLLSKKESELSVKTRFADQLQRQLKEVEAQAAAMRQDYEDLLTSVREETSLQRAHLNQQIDHERGLVRQCREQIESLEASYVKKLHDTAIKLDQVNAILREQERVTTARDINKEEMKLTVTRLQQENSLLREEITMLNGEHKRMMQESARFKDEVTRLERIIYGKPRTK